MKLKTLGLMLMMGALSSQSSLASNQKQQPAGWRSTLSSPITLGATVTGLAAGALCFKAHRHGVIDAIRKNPALVRNHLSNTYGKLPSALSAEFTNQLIANPEACASQHGYLFAAKAFKAASMPLVHIWRLPESIHRVRQAAWNHYHFYSTKARTWWPPESEYEEAEYLDARKQAAIYLFIAKQAENGKLFSCEEAAKRVGNIQ